MNPEQKKRLRVILIVGTVLLVLAIVFVLLEGTLWEADGQGRLNWLGSERYADPPVVPFGL